MHALMILLAATEAKAPLIMPAWVFPLIAAAFFLFAGIVTWTYRDVAHRHSDRVPSADEHGANDHHANDHGAPEHGASGSAH